MVAARRTFVRAFTESVTTHVIVLGSAVVALLMWSWWPLIAGVLIDFIVAPRFYWRTPLIVVSTDQRSRWRRGALIGAAIFVLLVIIAGLTDN